MQLTNQWRCPQLFTVQINDNIFCVFSKYWSYEKFTFFFFAFFFLFVLSFLLQSCIQWRLFIINMSEVSNYDTMPKALFKVHISTESTFNLATDVPRLCRSGLALELFSSSSFLSHLCITCEEDINITSVFFFRGLLYDNVTAISFSEYRLHFPVFLPFYYFFSSKMVPINLFLSLQITLKKTFHHRRLNVININ